MDLEADLGWGYLFEISLMGEGMARIYFWSGEGKRFGKWRVMVMGFGVGKGWLRGRKGE